ncbi:Thioredoxin domain-containing protein 2, partial [Bienertia sinuspersici]
MELAIILDDNNAKEVEVQKSDIGSANVVNVYGDTKSIPGVVLEKGSLPSESSKYKFSYSQKSQNVRDFFFNELYSIPTCARKIVPLPTFDLLMPSPTNVLSDPISSNEGMSKDSFSGDRMNVDCSIKDVVLQEPDSSTIFELLKVDEKSSVINSLADDAGATVSEEHCIVTEVTSANDMSVNYDLIGFDSEKVPEEVSISSAKDDELVVQDGDATGSIPKSVQYNKTNLEEDDELVVRDGDVTGSIAKSVQQKETNLEENVELVVQDGDATGTITESVQHNETNLQENVDAGLSGYSSEHTASPPKASLSLNEGFVQNLPIITPLKVKCPHVDGSYSSIDQSAPICEVTTPQYIQEDTSEKVKEYVDLVEEETDVDDSNLERLISDIEKSIENFSSINEEIKKEFGEEDGKNVTEDVGTSRLQPVSFHKDEEVVDSKNDESFAAETEDSRKGKAESSEAIGTYNDLPVRNCDIIVSRTLQQQRNKYLDELSHQERVLTDFLFYSEYTDVSSASKIINPANPDIHVCMSKTDFLSLAPRTWLTEASIDAFRYVFNRREEEKPGNLRRFWFNLLPFRKKKERINSIIAEREIDLEKAKDNPHYDTMKVEWLKGKEKMTYRGSSFFSDKCRQSMSSWEKMFPNNSFRHADLRHGFDGLHHWKRRTIPFSWRSNQNDFDCGFFFRESYECYDGGNEKKDPITTLSTAYTKNLARCQLDIDLVSYTENRRKQEVLKDCAFWSTTKPFLIQRQKRRKDKEKHLANLRAKRVEKVFLEDEKIREERARHEQEDNDFLNNDFDDSP